jgi:probable phosphoglycerate mutase
MADYLEKNTYFLLRHGEAEHNLKGFIASSHIEDGGSPSHLTDEGRGQIEGVAKELADENIDFIYTSPYTRTVETADIVSKSLGLGVIKDERLRELDAGVLDGVKIEEWRAFFEGKDKLTATPEGGENLLDVHRRVKSFLDDLHGRYTDKKLLLVSHGDLLLAAEAILKGIEGEAMLQIPLIRPGELRRTMA